MVEQLLTPLTSSTTCPSGATLSTQATNAGTGSNVSGVGTIDWTATENITIADGVFAQAVLTTGARLDISRVQIMDSIYLLMQQSMELQ